MPVAFKAAGTNSQATSTAAQTISITVPFPSGWGAGDFAILHARLASTSSGAMAAPAGWTQFDARISGVAQYFLYWKRLDGTESAPTLSDNFSGAGYLAATVTTYSGVVIDSGIAPIINVTTGSDTYSNGGSVDGLTWGSITPSSDGLAMVFHTVTQNYAAVDTFDTNWSGATPPYSASTPWTIQYVQVGATGSNTEYNQAILIEREAQNGVATRPFNFRKSRYNTTENATSYYSAFTLVADNSPFVAYKGVSPAASKTATASNLSVTADYSSVAWVAGDVAVLAVTFTVNGSNNFNATPTGTWTLFADHQPGTAAGYGCRTQYFYRFLDGSDTGQVGVSVSYGSTNAVGLAAQVVIYSGQSVDPSVAPYVSTTVSNNTVSNGNVATTAPYDNRLPVPSQNSPLQSRTIVAATILTGQNTATYCTLDSWGQLDERIDSGVRNSGLWAQAWVGDYGTRYSGSLTPDPLQVTGYGYSIPYNLTSIQFQSLAGIESTDQFVGSVYNPPSFTLAGSEAVDTFQGSVVGNPVIALGATEAADAFGSNLYNFAPPPIPTYVGRASGITASTSSQATRTTSVGAITGAATTDYLYAFVSVLGNTTNAPTPPAAYNTLLAGPVIVGAGTTRQISTWLYGGPYNGTNGGSWPCVLPGGTASTYAIAVSTVVYRGIDPNNPVENVVTGTSTATSPLPGLTLTSNASNRLLIQQFVRFGNYTATPPTGWTERVDTNSTTPTAGGAYSEKLNDYALASAGSVTHGNETYSTANAQNANLIGFAIHGVDPSNEVVQTSSTESPDAYSGGMSTDGAAPASVSGSLASTEAADTSAVSGQIVNVGSLSTVGPVDTASGSGQVLTSGSLASNESPDTGGFSGQSSSGANLASNEAPDSAALTGQVKTSGSLSPAETPDGATVAAQLTTLGSLSSSESSDAAAVSGSLSTTSRPWNPAQDLSGIVAWWDANQGVTLSGSNVTQWVDVVGGVVASVGGVNPVFSATGRNNNPSVNFVNNASLNFSVPNTFPVGSNPGVIALSGYLRTTTSPGRWAFSYGNGNGGTRYVTSDSAQNGAGGVSIGVGGYGSNDYTAESWIGYDRFLVGTFGPGNSLSANVDGLPTESSTSAVNINTTTGGGCFGKWPDYGDTWDGWISQVIIVNQALSDAVRQQLEGWESWYSGKAGSNLPANHPYKNAAPQVQTASPPTGSLTSTESSDTAALTGSLLTAGALAASESADTASLIGSSANAGILSSSETPDSASISGSAAAGGSIAALESPDAGSLSGSITTPGALGASETGDSPAISGKIVATGSLSASESPDTIAVGGQALNGGTLAGTETGDSATGAGGTSTTGAISVGEPSDSATLSGSLITSGGLSRTEAADSAAMSGGVITSGSLSSSENADTTSFAAGGTSTGTLVISEAFDAASLSGSVTAAGSLSTSETADTALLGGSIIGAGNLATTEAGDMSAVGGQLVSAGSVIASETPDGVALGVQVSTSGAFASSESTDITSFAGVVGPRGTVQAQESADGSVITGGLSTSGYLSTSENSDTAALGGVQATGGTLAASEGSDAALLSATQATAGSLAGMEQGDSATGSGGLSTVGLVAANENADGASISGKLTTTGSLTGSEVGDTTAFTASAFNRGPLAGTEAQDTAATTVTVTTVGSVLASEGSDQAAVVATAATVGAFGGSESMDSATFVGIVGAGGSLSASEGPDTAAVALTSTTKGSIIVSEAGDLANVGGTLTSAGALVTTETGDGTSLSVAVRNDGAITSQEISDGITLSGKVYSPGGLDAHEQGDGVAISGGTSTSGNLGVGEAPDNVGLDIEAKILAILTTDEGADTSSLGGSVIDRADLATSETGDGAAVSITVITYGVIATSEAQDATSFDVWAGTSGSLGGSEEPDTGEANVTVITLGDIAANENGDRAYVHNAALFGPLATSEAVDIAYFPGETLMPVAQVRLHGLISTQISLKGRITTTITSKGKLR